MAIKRSILKKCGLKSCKNRGKNNYCSHDHYLLAINEARVIAIGKAMKKNKTTVNYKYKMFTPVQRVIITKKKGINFGSTNRKPIKRRSKKRAEQEKEYLILNKKFLAEGHICPVTGDPATEVHHKKGRIGKLLTDVRYFLGVSSKGHHYIETHPAEAYEKGWSLKRNAI